MKILLSGAMVYVGGGLTRQDIHIEDGILADMGEGLSQKGCDALFDFSNHFIFPGFADVHVHLREPGFSYKETIRTGTEAAAASGYTALCAMPNLEPPPGTPEGLSAQQRMIDESAVIPVYPYACITTEQKGEGQLCDYRALMPHCFGFSDDGKGIQRGELMEQAMRAIRQAGGFIAAHVEDEGLLEGGYIHDGPYAKERGHAGICSESEWGQLKRDIDLVRRTGCRYHMCHVSTKESVALLRAAKLEGLPVTAETAPHYLVLCQDDLQEDGRFKMNPPLREADDRTALMDGILDGTLDMIATDHAPHAEREKDKGLKGSAMGITGLETAFPILYTELVRKGILTLGALVDLMAVAPRRVFPGLGGGELTIGRPADLCVWDLNASYTIDPERFRSMGRATPFAGWPVQGRCVMTVAGGRVVHKEI